MAAFTSEALDLWRGDPFADVADEPFVRSEVSKLEELRLGCFEELVDAELALGRHAELVPRHEAEVRREPLRERLRAQLMLALYRSGRQADALSAYQDARRTLVDELGLEPGPTCVGWRRRSSRRILCSTRRCAERSRCGDADDG